MNIDYSLFPNTDGNLGKTKVKIPDGTTVTWPDGDALVGHFIYKDGELCGFVDTGALIANDSKTTIINYDYFDIELPFTEGEISITRGERSKYFNVRYNPGSTEEEIVYIRFEELSDETKTLLRSATTIRDNVLYDGNDNVIGEFNTDALLTCHNLVINENGEPALDESTEMPLTTDGKPMDILFTGIDFTGQSKDIKLVTFDSDLSSLTNAVYMFMSCENLTSFNGDLSSLTYGAVMFYHCSNLTSFSSDLPNLTNGTNMFVMCENLTSFSSDLPSLIYGGGMFVGCSLTSFTSDLPNLIDGNRMFNACDFESFNSNLSSLTNGWLMFSYCSNLTSFTSDLPSLTNGYEMFYYCKLDTASVQHIADTIKNVSSLTNGSSKEDEVYKTIHIGIGNSTPNEQEKAAFNTIASKGWTVYVNNSQYTLSSVSSIMTLDELGNEIETPIPYYAKPVPATEETASYVDANGNFFNIVGAQFIYGDDISTYGMFTCEEDAAANMRLTKHERPEVEETNPMSILTAEEKKEKLMKLFRRNKF